MGHIPEERSIDTDPRKPQDLNYPTNFQSLDLSLLGNDV